jgi:HSP20 family protein
MAEVPVTRRRSGGQLATRRAQPAQPLQRLHQSLDTLFDRMWRGWLGPYERDFGSVRLWDFDVMENDNEVVVRAELPGFEETEIEVQVSNDVLTIKAQKEERAEGEEEFRSFFRSITLPSGTDADKARAVYHSAGCARNPSCLS